jgi:tRNA-2-methylthio-N6-dimethylallyladenosine synthase
MPYLHLPVQSGLRPRLAAMNRRHTATSTAASSTTCAQSGPISRCPPIYRRLPGRERGGVRRHPASRRGHRLLERLFVQVQRAPWHPGRRTRRTGQGGRQDGAAGPAPGASGAPAPSLHGSDGRPHRRRTLGEAGRHPGQLAGKSPYLQPVQIETDHHAIGEVVPVRILRAGSNSLFGEAFRARQPQSRGSSALPRPMRP